MLLTKGTVLYGKPLEFVWLKLRNPQPASAQFPLFPPSGDDHSVSGSKSLTQ